MHILNEIQLHDIVVFNPCAINNGECSHFCLLSATNPRGYSCDCPVGMVLSDNTLTCIGTIPGTACDTITVGSVKLWSSSYSTSITRST